MPVTNKIATLSIVGVLCGTALTIGVWQLYERINPSFHNSLLNRGFHWKPMEGNLKSKDSLYLNLLDENVYSELGGDWECSKRLFSGLVDPVTNAWSQNIDRNGVIPTVENSSSTGIRSGCLVSDFAYKNDERTDQMHTFKRGAGTFKWELSLKRGERGFIYMGMVNITQMIDSSRSLVSIFSTSYVFSLREENGVWKVKSGLSWLDTFSGDKGTSVTISTPNKTYVLSGDYEKDRVLEDNYSGFWEEDIDGKDSVLGVLGMKQGNKELDLWGLSNFDNISLKSIPKVQPTYSDSLVVSSFDSSAWKLIVSGGDASNYLEKIYSPWKGEVGIWRSFREFCENERWKRLNDDSNTRLKLERFCYEKN